MYGVWLELGTVNDGEADHDMDGDHDVSHCFFYIARLSTPLHEQYYSTQVMNSNLDSNSHYGSS